MGAGPGMPMGGPMGGLGGLGGGAGTPFGQGGKPRLPFDTESQYDLIIIGGGTGGLSCAQEAKALGLKVAIFDYVSPSPQGSTWGLGGTCVNVGCIPKKLMHIAAQTKEHSSACKDFGWKQTEQKGMEHDWITLRNNVQSYIKQINFGYVSKMAEQGIDYINAKASFSDQQTVTFMYRDPLAAPEDKGKEY